jgi:hypothetical protein
LIDKLDALENGDESRVALKAAARAKKKASKTKKAKRKYRKTDEADGTDIAGTGIVSGEEEGDRAAIKHDLIGMTESRNTGNGR